MSVLPLARPASVPGFTRRRAIAAATAATLGATRVPSSLAALAPSSPRDEALHALNRLAFGPAPGDLVRVRRMGVAAWIDEQLDPSRLPLPAPLAQTLDTFETLKLPARELIRRYRAYEAEGKRQAAAQQPHAGAASNAMNAMNAADPSMAPPGSLAAGDVPPADLERRAFVGQVHLEAAQARLLRAIGSPRQLEEVMVDFWFDHFNVHDAKGIVHVLGGAYERDAIRPHAMGRFRTLLGATARHSAMLFYLDNWLSVRSDWQPPPNAKNAPTGLNENYARELMELHTLGVDGGYTQADVTQLARMFTGWTLFTYNKAGLRASGEDGFFFDAARHDDGTKTWLGHTVAPRGQAEGEWALDMLAAHPSTARRIATKLAQRFVADSPPPALVSHVAQRFLASQGDIRDTLRALIEHPAFREAAAREPQYKTPYEFIVSAMRAAAMPTTNLRPVLGALGSLGQPIYGCPTPDGWAHVQSAWLNPDAVTRRITFATALAMGRLPLAGAPEAAGSPASSPDHPVAPVHAKGRTTAPLPETEVASRSTPPVDEVALLETLGPAITPATRAVIDRAPPSLHAAMVLGSPDFMHR
jgi:uncharacterized protein (DUF1800 family)